MNISKAILVFASVMLVSEGAFAAETLDAESVKKLISNKTVHAETPNGKLITYFSPDGKAIRKGDEGTWTVKQDGTHCIDGMRGGCAKVSSNGDGTYTRGPVKWTSFVEGKAL